MKLSPLIAAALVVFLALSGPTDARGKKPKPPKKPKTCKGKDGVRYEIGEGYFDRESCIEYTCSKKGKGAKMTQKKVPCGTTTQLPTAGFQLHATCDNTMKIFANGNLLATDDDWTKTTSVDIPSGTSSVEVHCTDLGVVGGILAFADNGLKSDGSWSCSSDGGSTWNLAYEGVRPQIPEDAKWIWTGKNTYHGEHKNVICKITLGTTTTEAIPPTTTPSPTTEKCPWSTPTSKGGMMQCGDGTFCNVKKGSKWSCCKNHDGRRKCPPSYYMCAAKTCVGNTQHCCEPMCDRHGGPRPCEDLGAMERKIESLEESVRSILANMATMQSTSDKLGLNITSNMDSIKNNRESIVTNQEDISSHEQSISKNKDSISTNSDTCSEAKITAHNLELNITTNTDSIKTIKEDIVTNQEDISSHNVAISRNINSISTNSDTCSDVKIAAHNLGACLADVTSTDCPSEEGKTSITDAIQNNKETINAQGGGVVTSAVLCPVGWTFLSTGCYKFTDEGTHQEATTKCQNEGGFLIEVDNQEELDAAYQFYKDEGFSEVKVWLGATDIAKEGDWIWTRSGKKMKFTAWISGEPNGGTSENCLEAYGNNNFKWNDQSCDDHNLRGLCELPTCPDGWTTLSTGCYKFTMNAGTHQNATTNCEGEGGFLIEIDNQEELDAAFQFYKEEGFSEDKVWLGANDITKEGDWIWTRSGKKMNFTAWISGEPNGGASENCLEAYGNNNFKWNDQSCDDDNLRGLCEFNGKSAAPVTTPLNNGCSIGEEYEGNCYLLVETAKTWVDALVECYEMNGTLASVHNDETNNYLANLAGDSRTWIGATDVETEGSWKWTNGDDVLFTNWYPGEPNNKAGSQDCAVINYQETGKWDDDACVQAHHPFICQGNHLSNVTSGLFSAPVKACLKHFNNEMIETGLTLEECKQRCLSATSFVCKSFDYSAPEFGSECYLSEETKDTQPSAYTEPCYIESDTSFYIERIFNSNQMGYRVSGIPTNQVTAKVGSTLWTDRSISDDHYYTITKMPQELIGSTLFQPIHYVDKSTIEIFSPHDATIYVALYEPRDGGLMEILPNQGWTLKEGWFVEWNLGSGVRLNKIWSKQVDAGNTISFTTSKNDMTFVIFISKVCPQGWKIYDGSCYRLLPQRSTTYDSAEEICQDFGAELVSLEAKDENDFVEKMLNEARDDGILSDHGTDIWLSARRPDTGSPYIWKSGSSVTFSDWYSGQPGDDHHGVALCMQTFRNSESFWTWYVANCDGGDVDNGVVCEKKALALP